jgi:rod shape-determining protein MreD
MILNDVELKSLFNIACIPVFSPLLYPVLIMLLPIQTPHWLQMALGFIIGIIIDFSCSTPGMHASACVLLAYVRPTIIRLFFQQPIKELSGVTPSLFRMGIQSFLLYCVFCLLIHHFFYYLIEFWSIKKILFVLLKTILSTIMTLILILLGQLLFTSRNVRRL